MENLKRIKDVSSFEELMPFKVKRVMLVASLYDSFLLSDDETLNEVFFSEMTDHFRRTSAHMERAKSVNEALNLLENEKFDLIISMLQVGEADMDSFVKSVSQKAQGAPIVFLSFNAQDVSNISDYVKNLAAGIFLWHGDTRIFSAIINLIEDSMNFTKDASFGVQAVLLVEDNVKFYSMYLPIIYSELMKQTQIVMSEELNPTKKNLRLKARPKILLKTDFEGAWDVYSKHKENLLGVISDIEYPKGQKSMPEAGIYLTEKIKKETPDMPILLQSSNQDYFSHALSLGASFINKNSSDLSKQIRGFIQRYFGFGDFIFSDENGMEIARAGDLSSMLKALKTIPASSIIYHASRNHFSKWLFARTEFEIAYNLRPKKISEFKDGEEIRKYLLETMHQFVYKNQLGSVLKFDPRFYDSSIPFAKIGRGSIGGKARGLAFIDYLMSKNIIPEYIDSVKITTPNSVVISTDVFDFFIDNNNIEWMLNENYSDEKTAELFSKIKLPDYALNEIYSALEKMNFPLAVRSSSMLEDSKTHPLAGIYKTYMLKNNSSSFTERMDDLKKAVKYIYASVFSKEAGVFRKMSSGSLEEEKMAVIIQRVIGRPYVNGYFYPLISGVLQSYNFYPVPPLLPEDCVAHICAGLGETVVAGQNSLRYSPASPGNIHQFSTVKDTLLNSQKKLICLNLNSNENISYFSSGCVETVGVEAFESSEGFNLLTSYYNPQEERIYDSYRENSFAVVNFAPVVKNSLVPLNNILKQLSSICSDAIGANVEMEFALDYNPISKESIFNILQIRPMSSKSGLKKVNMDFPQNSKKILFCEKALGNGIISGISDIVFVKRQNFSNLKTVQMVSEINMLNERLRKEGRNYVLMGPGRWGSSDVHLGIPVKWNDISKASVIVECRYGDFWVDPSHGTHFFHNVTSLGIGYFSMLSSKDFIDWNFLESNKSVFETEHLKHIRFASPLDIRVDGLNSQGAIYSV